ncbi:hypothetical protein J6590_079554 [Homalodisca vitripennis]|nr:hypothetical protein J6590_079554 [Homalodisca vitripennis]
MELSCGHEVNRREVEQAWRASSRGGADIPSPCAVIYGVEGDILIWQRLVEQAWGVGFVDTHGDYDLH